ncbi:MAG: cation-transporting P-type ATPase [Clostridia bacterium]|nr:cation-transporting P-type ATPase [Clostridia bacterium]
MAEKWYNLTPVQIAARLSTDLASGLSPKQAQARLRREGKNTIYRTESPRPSDLIWDVLRDPCAYMLIAAAILAWIFNIKVGAPLIILLVVLNSLFVLFTYIRARNAIARSEEKSIPTATVIRGGKQYLIRQDRLCRGDIIILTPGDVVPADARLIEAYRLQVLETTLSGEKVKKSKSAQIIYANNLSPEKQADMVFAGTVVLSGEARALVCEIGEDTLKAVFKNEEQHKSKAEDVPPYLVSLKKYCSVWSLIMLVMVFCLTLVDFILGFGSGSIFNIFITGLSIATAAMCEYYLVFGYIIVGYSLFDVTGRDAKKNMGAVIKSIGSTDRLTGITTLIVPKEGAFTAGRIKLKKLYCDSVLYAPDERNLHHNCQALISAAFDSTTYPLRDYEKTYNRFKAREASVEENCIYTLAMQSSVFDGPVYMASHIMTDHRVEGEITRTRLEVNGRSRICIRGKAEDILPLCSYYRASEKVKDIKNEKNRVRSIIDDLYSKGLYALCIATKNTDSISDTRGFIFEGFIAFNQPRLGGVKENINRIREADIKVIMLSEDSGNRDYARSVGIIGTDEEIMTSVGFDALADNELTSYTLYEGLSIAQKRQLIFRLQKSGESVGYFGCDLEDMLPVREADVGFSSGITLHRGNSTLSVGSENAPVYISSREEKGTGSEALKEACDVIVSPAEGNIGGFNAITDSIARARRAFGSLHRAVRYLIISQSARLFIFLYSAMLPIKAIPFCGEDILTPVQLLLLGLVFDLGAVIAFASKSSKGIIAKRQTRDKLTGNMLFGIIWGAIALLPSVIAVLCGMDMTGKAMSATVFYGFILSSFICALEALNRRSVFKKGYISPLRAIIGILIMAAFIALSALTGLFDGCMLTLPQWGIMLIQPVVVLGMFEFYKLLKGRKNDRDKEADKEGQR